MPLVLSGHTHAGQFTLARMHEIALGHLVGHKYVHGLYGKPARTIGAVYVGAGLGAAVMPFRIGDRARREITIFELGAPPGHRRAPSSQPALTGRPPSETKQRAEAVMKKRERRERRAAKRPPKIEG